MVSTSNARTARIGSVLSGGGARGAYEARAISILAPALEARDERPTLFVGTSVGAINASYMGASRHLDAEEQAAGLLERWQEVTKDSVIRPILLQQLPLTALRYAGELLSLPGIRLPSLLDPKPLERSLKRWMSWGDLHRNVEHGLVHAVAVVATAARTGRTVAFVEKSGLTLLKTTPFFDSNALATLPSYASKHGLKSIADLKGLGRSVKLGAPPEFATRFEGLPGIKQEYGVNPTFVPIAIELSYKALEGGQVDVQNVFTTDGQLLSGKFTLLADPKHVFGFQNVAPIVRRSVLAAEGPAFGETLDKVSSLLTIKAIQQMNAAVSIDKQTPASVAQQFLHANGLA